MAYCIWHVRVVLCPLLARFLLPRRGLDFLTEFHPSHHVYLVFLVLGVATTSVLTLLFTTVGCQLQYLTTVTRLA